MKRKKFWRRAAAWFWMPLWVLAAAAGAQEEGEQARRYHALINELRCLVCQNQSIAESNAPLAADLRRQVREKIAAGESNQDILRHLTDRYGDFVLYRPPFRAATAALWLSPFLLTAAAIWWFLRRKSPPPAAQLDEAQRRRLNALLKNESKNGRD